MGSTRKTRIGVFVIAVIAMGAFAMLLSGLAGVTGSASGQVAAEPEAKSLLGDEIPPGTIVAFAGPRRKEGKDNIPRGWVLCDGKAYPREGGKCGKLFKKIGTSWGDGDGKETFNVPDLQGMFLRGVNGTSKNDPDVKLRTAVSKEGKPELVGSKQEDATRIAPDAIGEPIPVNERTYTTGTTDNSAGPYFAGAARDSNNTLSGNKATTGGSHKHSIRSAKETRPKNVYVNFIIKL